MQNSVTFHFHMYYYSLETCIELPPGKNLITPTEFPVDRGTGVFVNCEEGYSLVGGDTIITCQKDAEYLYKTEPDCQRGRTFNEFIY